LNKRDITGGTTDGGDERQRNNERHDFACANVFLGDDELILLVVISVVGLVLSVIVHFCSVLRICEPPRELMILISIGAMLVLYPSFIIVNKLRKQDSTKDFKKALFAACPKWLSTLTGFSIMYALGGLMFFILKRHFATSPATDGQGVVTTGFKGFSGHWIALYCLAFSLLYSCRRLKKSKRLVER
jgi:hypothetical protein